ncbi:MAG: beta-N-acetylhexosaminidase [Alphaproteobacteria bacterium]|nr:beta-N-acetylhexosaminidase [Alphaproteobacteria bacterium]
MILGCAGHELADDERRLFADAQPLGFILFARNVRDPAQLRRLTTMLRDAVGRADAPILVDQEGGRVQRLRPPHWRAAPPAAAFGRLHAVAPSAALEATRLNHRLIGLEALRVGFDTVCAPVGDVPVEGAHDVIGDRAFARDPSAVAALAAAAIEGLADVGVTAVMKHLPGHGRAGADSHLEMPRVEAGRTELLAHDGVPFRALRHAAPWAMTAHVLYPALDPSRPGTVSPAVLRFIREDLGFDGVLLSDDLAMKALGGPPGQRVADSLAAGCDVALYCAGDIETNRAILGTAPRLAAAAAERLRRAAATRCRVAPDPVRWQGRLDGLLGGLTP